MHLNKVTIEDTKVKYRRLHSCMQNLDLSVLRRLGFLSNERRVKENMEHSTLFH